LENISQENDIKIIFASECGSRAYGLNSNASDYDIRFIYIHNDKSKYHEYFTLQAKHRKKMLYNINVNYYDDIEQKTITGRKKTKKNKYDWHGWDVTKAIQHLKEMNPSIVEWIYSPIVYTNDSDFDFLEKSKDLLKSQNRILPLLKHDRAMARRHFYEYVDKKCQVRIKKYMVMLRCCGMIRWLLNFNFKDDDDLEINFIKVVSDITPFINKRIMKEIEFVIEKKKESENKYDAMNRIKLLDEWILFYINGIEHRFEIIKLREFDTDNPENAPYSQYVFKCIND
jgi:hypothetical protein